MKHIIDIINEDKITDFVDIFVLVDNEILCLRRANYLKFNRGKWCIPGGSRDLNEKGPESIVRELKEETNIIINNPKFEFCHEYVNNKSTSIYSVKLNEKPEVKISREHAQYKWLTFEQIQNMKEKFPPETFEIIYKFFNR